MEDKHHIEDLFRSIKDFHNQENLPDLKINVQHPGLIPVLRPYQVKAVEWMVYKETQPVLHNISIRHSDPKMENDYDGELHILKLPTGGILADEMGLGKTVEVLACILANPRNISLDKQDEYKLSSASKYPDLELSSSLGKERQTESSEDTTMISPPCHLSFSQKQLLKMIKSFKRKKVERDDWPLSVRLAEERSFKRKALRQVNKKKSAVRKRKTAALSTSMKTKPQKSAAREAAEAWYLTKLSEVNTCPIRASRERYQESNVQCICGEEDNDNLKVVNCEHCKRLLHSICIGATVRHHGQPIYCPECWLREDRVPSGTTLIVSPTSISGQWLSEVYNHVKKSTNLKVLVYKGVRTDGFTQPHELAKYDLILTTYEVMQSELVLADVPERRTLRFAKRYFAPTCPLLCVEFWRICLDEAQMVEGTTCKAAEMVSRLFSIHRWAVTGTPIQKTVYDLYGLVLFLRIEPYCDRSSWQSSIWNPFQEGTKAPLHTLMSHIMWRSCKIDVLDQIKLPPQTEQISWLNFSPVEEHFYHRTHSECSNDFLERMLQFDSLDVTLDSLRVVTVNKVLAPLLKLRQACSHPQAVRGKLITAQKGTMTMAELLESLIKKTKVEGEEALRAHIASLNGMAGLHVICNEYVSAAEKYRGVLQIAEQYKDRFKVDTLQRLHTLHNLAEVLAAHRDVIPPTLRDDQLKDEEKELEIKYMSRAQNQVTSVEEALSEAKASVLQLEDELSEENDPDWWVNLSHWLCLSYDVEVLSRVHDTLLNNMKSIPEITSRSIINRVSTPSGIRSEICKWLEQLMKAKEKATNSLHKLQVTDAETVVNQAVDCHLRASNLKKKTPKVRCELCACENLLKDYEVRLFDVKSKKHENVMVGNVLLLGQNNQGSWTPSEPERVLRVLVTMGKQKKAHQWITTGNTFLKLCDALRKEFKHLRMLWTRIDERTCAQDELNMCKLRLRLRLPGEEVPSNSTNVNGKRKLGGETKSLSSNLDTKRENLHIIEPHKVEAMSLTLQSEATVAFSEFLKKSGTVVYLQNLRQRGGDSSSTTNTEICPICQNGLGDRWSVLSCGHCLCMDCMPTLMGKKLKHTPCPVCREITDHSDISFVNLVHHEASEEISLPGSVNIPQVQGSHSTKVEGVVRRLLYLRAVDPLVKVLIFSTWDRVLDVLDQAIEQNGIRHLRLKSGSGYQLTLQNFKDMNSEEPVTALLLPLRLGAKGLNLTEATHVILVEPILNPSEELQAIGRVHRLGQTRPTVVHRFLIRGTIEERMFSAVQATGKEEWSGDSVTLQQLKNLFTVPLDKAMERKDVHSSSVESSVIDVQGTSTTLSEVSDPVHFSELGGSSSTNISCPSNSSSNVTSQDWHNSQVDIKSKIKLEHSHLSQDSEDTAMECDTEVEVQQRENGIIMNRTEIISVSKNGNGTSFASDPPSDSAHPIKMEDEDVTYLSRSGDFDASMSS